MPNAVAIRSGAIQDFLGAVIGAAGGGKAPGVGTVAPPGPAAFIVCPSEASVPTGVL